MNGHEHSSSDEPHLFQDGHQPELPWNPDPEGEHPSGDATAPHEETGAKPVETPEIGADAFAALADAQPPAPAPGAPSGSEPPAAPPSEEPATLPGEETPTAPAEEPSAEPTAEPAAMPAEESADADTAGVAPAEAGAAEAPVTTEPPRLIERERPKRRPLVPGRIIGIVVAVIAVIALAAVGTAWFVSASRVTVPDFRDKPLAVARVEASRAGVKINISARRFSPTARDQVLEQDPMAGTRVPRGTTINVVISAGTEQFALPDVTGLGIELARGTLESRGLRVEVQTQASQEASGTVLLMNPSPNSPVQTGDTIRLTVATASADKNGLRPFKLQGRVFVLDPASAPDGAGDTPMEITRRVRALLEASGATVTSTRSAIETDAPAGSRAAKAKAASPDAVVGMSVSTTSGAGIVVLRPTGGEAAKVTASTELQGDITEAITAAGHTARRGTKASDAVLDATAAPSVQVVLGSAASEEDVAAFRDPKWADSVARAIYLVLGERFDGS